MFWVIAMSSSRQPRPFLTWAAVIRSGRRDSNPRPIAWEELTLALSTRLLQSRNCCGFFVVPPGWLGAQQLPGADSPIWQPTLPPRLHHRRATPWPQPSHGCTTAFCSHSMREYSIVARSITSITSTNTNLRTKNTPVSGIRSGRAETDRRPIGGANSSLARNPAKPGTTTKAGKVGKAGRSGKTRWDRMRKDDINLAHLTDLLVNEKAASGKSGQTVTWYTGAL